MAHITVVIQQAQTARSCAPPPSRLWKDLLGYHGIGEGMTNPTNGLSIDIVDTFSQFDNNSFPCTAEDPTYGGLGSEFKILERAMAINHAMTHDPFSGRSDHVTMDCLCVTGEGDPARPYYMSLPGFLPHVSSRVAETRSLLRTWQLGSQ